MDIVAQAAALRDDRPAEAEEIIRQGLKQYPGNDILLNNLLYTMRAPERSGEVVTLCKSILEVTRLDEVKYDVLRILAETYHDMGCQDLVKPTLEQIPEIYFSKLELAAKLLTGDDAMKAAKTHATLCRDDLLDMFSRISQLYRQQGDTEQADIYAALTKQVYALFEGRTDFLAYQGQEPQWLEEEIWPRLND